MKSFEYISCFEGIDCGQPAPVEQGTSHVSGTRYPAGHISYACTAGFYMEGQGYMHCLSTGNWSNEQPTCLGEFYKTRELSFCHFGLEIH